MPNRKPKNPKTPTSKKRSSRSRAQKWTDEPAVASPGLSEHLGTDRGAPTTAASPIDSQHRHRRRQRLLEVAVLIGAPLAFAQVLANVITLFSKSEVWYPGISIPTLLITLAYYFGLRLPRVRPPTLWMQAAIAFATAAGAILIPRWLTFAIWERVALAVIGAAVPFAAALANAAGRRGGRAQSAPASQVFAFTLVATLAAVVSAWIGLAMWSSSGPAPIVYYYADFVRWTPPPASGVAFPALGSESLRPGDELPQEAVFQEAVYWWLEVLGRHSGGVARNKSSSPQGQLHVDVLYPHGIAVENGEEVRDGIKHHTSEYLIPLKGLTELLVRTTHYNCFTIDEHTYGWTLRTDAETIDVTFDFSRFKKEDVFDLSYRPRILLITAPHTTGEDVTDQALWDHANILHAERKNVKEGSQFVLDCKWRRGPVPKAR